LVWEALVAAEALEQQGISAEVINIHTIKPLDEAILKSLAKTKCIVTAEEHNIWWSWQRFKSFGIKQSSSTRVCCC
jgi:transketolase C-terminal domain/subunit